MISIVKTATVMLLAAAFIVPAVTPSQALALHIGGSWSNLFIEGGTPKILGGGDDKKTVVVNDPEIQGTCSANTGSVNVGYSVSWTVYPSGGNGTYTYNWSGSDSLSGSNSTVQKVYGLAGSKTASVTVTSHGVAKVITCSTVVQVIDNNNNNNGGNNYNTLYASCQPNTTNTNVGNTVTWSANVNGGNGNYYYSWSGTDGLNGTGSYASRSYSYSGTKTASVTVTSNGQSVTSYCGNSVYVNDNNYYNNNNYNNGYQYIGYDGYQFIGGGYNNYNNGYYDQYNSNPLNVSCSANMASGLSGNSVTWTALVTGGNGAYTYAWAGTDSLTGYTQSVNKTYWYAGSKLATVTVTSNGQTITRACGNTVAISTRPISVVANNTTAGDYPPAVVAKPAAKTPELAIACSANTQNINANETIVWISNVTGGNNKYTYEWQGSDGLASDSNFVAKTYVTNGQKTAVLTVKSGTQTKTAICGNIAVGAIATNGTNGMAASALFGNWAGSFIVILLIAIIAFLGVILYFLNLRDKARPVQVPNNTPNNNIQ